MKLDILFHYEMDEDGTIHYIGKEEIKVNTGIASANTVLDPIVTLETNKLVLTKGSADLLEAQYGDRICVKYKKVGQVSRPIIGKGTVFNTPKAGNKLTQKLTMSFRGEANQKLAEYGTEFKLEPSEDKGIFYLVGEKVPEEQPVPEEIENISEELNLDEVDETNFDFNLDD